MLSISPIFYGDISQNTRKMKLYGHEHEDRSYLQHKHRGYVQDDQSSYDNNEDKAAVHERRVREADEVESRIFGGSRYHEQFAHFQQRLYRDIRLEQFF